jgi:signal transduction histidine kinase
MDSATDRDRSPETWLLETLSAVSEAVSDGTDRVDLGRQLPTALTEPPEHSAAWIGHPIRSTDRIRVRASAPAFPETIANVAESSTQRALDSGVCLLDASESPEYERLREGGEVPTATGVVVIPIPALQHSAVLHLYTDADLSPPAVSETMARIEGLLAEGFAHRETHRKLARERDRLEQLRSLVSHDFGNPINIAAGRLDLVRSECDSEHLPHVESALETLEALADEGVLFVKAGRELEGQSEIDLGSLAEECWNMIDAPESSLTVERATVYAESERLRMILNQLFENAVVHTDGSVMVTVGPLAGEQGFYVEDDGPGVPADKREYVFDRGYTTVSERDGNGLALVEEIAGVFGWDVQAVEADGIRIEIRTGPW